MVGLCPKEGRFYATMSGMKSHQKENALKASITLPRELQLGLAEIAKKEHRSLSGVVQEAARLYLRTRQFDDLQRELSLLASANGVKSGDDVLKIIEELRR